MIIKKDRQEEGYQPIIKEKGYQPTKPTRIPPGDTEPSGGYQPIRDSGEDTVNEPTPPGDE